ncbi:MAG: NAD(P)-dependent oxidoreductase [Chloroflexi bacterium]|nr:MAG: NAD(P)-dependent oxidoreductase [Chloroflexota bacterium]
MTKKVTLIGLGAMGMGIAQSILKAGFDLTVYNRTTAKSETLAKLGARAMQSPREAVSDAEIVISIVADDTASRQIWLGEKGALDGVKPDTILVECSTLSLTWIRELADLATEGALALLDAPVNGGPDMAAAGQLRMMVGGDTTVLEQARPVLTSFSGEITHMGPNGTGTMTKLVHNMMVAVQMVALAEGLNMAERAGLSLEQVVSIITNSGPASPTVKRNAPLMASRNYGEPGFSLRLMRKDVAYALHLAEELDIPLMTANAAREVYRIAGKLGYDDAGVATVFEVLHQ